MNDDDERDMRNRYRNSLGHRLIVGAESERKGEPLVTIGSEQIDEFGEDFGHVVQRRPRAVVRPRDADDVARIMADAREAGTAVVPRGGGHSVFGQSQVADGWVLDMSGLARVRMNEDTVVAEAGATWRDVLRTTLPHGLMPPVLTDYAGLSVGGTLSVGGIGATSFIHGPQASTVIQLTAVTGSGSIQGCSHEREAELFHAVRAGLGQVAVIVEVELPLIAVPERVRHYRIIYAHHEPMLAELDRLAEARRFDEISAVGVIDHLGRWSFHIDAIHRFAGDRAPRDAELLDGLGSEIVEVSQLDATALDHALRLDAEIDGWRRSGLWQAPHPWADVFVPGEFLGSFANAVISSLGPDDLGMEGAMILVYPVTNGVTDTPCLPLPQGGRRAYLFDVLRCLPGAGSSRLSTILRANRKLYEDVLKVGGTLYPISAIPMSTEDWRRHYGAQWNRLRSAKLQYDPLGLLGGSCSIFPPHLLVPRIHP